MYAVQKIVDGDRFVVLIYDGVAVLVYVEEAERICVYRARPDGQWDAEYFDHDGELLGSKTAHFADGMTMTVRLVVGTGDRVVNDEFIQALVLMARMEPMM